MTATEIEVGKRFSRVAFKMQTPKPKLDRAEGMERWQNEGRGTIRGVGSQARTTVRLGAGPGIPLHNTARVLLSRCPRRSSRGAPPVNANGGSVQVMFIICHSWR